MDQPSDGFVVQASPLSKARKSVRGGPPGHFQRTHAPRGTVVSPPPMAGQTAMDRRVSTLKQHQDDQARPGEEMSKCRGTEASREAQ